MLRGVNNSMAELRNISNHPFLSRLHPEGSELLLPPHPLPAALRVCGKLAVLDSLLTKLCAAGHKVCSCSKMLSCACPLLICVTPNLGSLSHFRMLYEDETLGLTVQMGK